MKSLMTLLGALSICCSANANNQINCIQNLIPVDGAKVSLQFTQLTGDVYSLTKETESNVFGKIERHSVKIDGLSCRIELKVLNDLKTAALKKLTCGQSQYGANRQAKEFAVLEQTGSPAYRATEIDVIAPPLSKDGTEIGMQPDRNYTSLGKQFDCSVN